MAKRKLSARQETFVEARGKGVSREQSAILADGNAENAGALENSPTVKTELARIRAETITNTGLKKEDVVEMLMTAATMAKTIGDVQGLVASARELGKMLGFYAVEVKKTLHGVDKDALKKALKDLSDDELYQLAHARKVETIDGEAKRIPENL